MEKTENEFQSLFTKAYGFNAILYCRLYFPAIFYDKCALCLKYDKVWIKFVLYDVLCVCVIRNMLISDIVFLLICRGFLISRVTRLVLGNVRHIDSAHCYILSRTSDTVLYTFPWHKVFRNDKKVLLQILLVCIFTKIDITIGITCL